MSLNTCVNCGIRFTSDARFDTACQLCLAKCDGDPETVGLPKQVRAGLALMKRYEAENATLRAQVAAAKMVIDLAVSLLSEDSMREEANCYAIFPTLIEASEAFRKLMEKT